MSCCASDTTVTNVTCGQGKSCVGECSAIGASLCLSGVCTENPDDCNFSLESMERRKRGKDNSVATVNSEKLRWCYPACRVKHIPACCFHASCHALRPKLCGDKNYFSGVIDNVQQPLKILKVTPVPNLVAFPKAGGAVKCRSFPFLTPLSWTVMQTPFQVKITQKTTHTTYNNLLQPFSAD